ncbi:hypothetical protein [Actinokineospora sp.]|uniref:hypothetical protein n=1 Tax=Actinokineospora sp. TaxID=1872133 RepID=UPI003D6C36E0
MTLDDLVALRAGPWLRGDVIQVLAPARQLMREQYKVRGLDEDGHPTAPGVGARAVDRVASWVDETTDHGHVAVRGGDPSCAAVAMYRAVGTEHAWLAITSHRVAVLVLRDTTSAAEESEKVLAAIKAKPGLGNLMRGVGKLVKSTATELADSVRRPPLDQRPDDAVLEVPFEMGRQALRSVVRWKQPMVPEFGGGPRFVRVEFGDGSWARIQTDEAGAMALAGSG